MSVSVLLGLVYLISELLLTVTRRSRSRTGTKQDRSTLRLVWLVIIVSVAARIYVPKHWPASALPHHRSFFFAGMGLFVAGLLLRWWAIITLGRFLTVDVTIEKDHELAADRSASCDPFRSRRKRLRRFPRVTAVSGSQR
jgi:protein-S-isoprenylcysteine O-methyltransferase Ste14